MFSSDVYNADLWYLELHSPTASKYNAVNYLRNYYGFAKVIGLGDNFNNLPLYRACDEFFAVKNAISELKELAAGIIGDNQDDGVARFIEKREGLSKLLAAR